MNFKFPGYFCSSFGIYSAGRGVCVTHTDTHTQIIHIITFIPGIFSGFHFSPLFTLNLLSLGYDSVDYVDYYGEGK